MKWPGYCITGSVATGSHDNQPGQEKRVGRPSLKDSGSGLYRLPWCTDD